MADVFLSCNILTELFCGLTVLPVEQDVHPPLLLSPHGLLHQVHRLRACQGTLQTQTERFVWSSESDVGRRLAALNLVEAYLSGKPPNQQRWHAKWEAQLECVHISYTIFARFGADLHAQSVLINKIFASELSPNLVKSALLVGQYTFDKEKLSVCWEAFQVDLISASAALALLQKCIGNVTKVFFYNWEFYSPFCLVGGRTFGQLFSLYSLTTFMLEKSLQICIQQIC